jgi:hypothetical protein
MEETDDEWPVRRVAVDRARATGSSGGDGLNIVGINLPHIVFQPIEGDVQGLYAAMGFSALVEGLNMLSRRAKARRKASMRGGASR